MPWGVSVTSYRKDWKLQWASWSVRPSLLLNSAPSQGTSQASAPSPARLEMHVTHFLQTPKRGTQSVGAWLQSSRFNRKPLTLIMVCLENRDDWKLSVFSFYPHSLVFGAVVGNVGAVVPVKPALAAASVAETVPSAATGSACRLAPVGERGAVAALSSASAHKHTSRFLRNTMWCACIHRDGHSVFMYTSCAFKVVH